MAPASESGVHGIPKTSPNHGQVSRKVQGKVAHKTRGRLRLRFPGASAAELHQVEAGIRSLPGVGKIEVHSQSGSVIVHHSLQHGDFSSHLSDLVRHSSLFYLEGMEDPSEGSAQLTAVEHDATYLVDHSKAGKAIVRYTEHLNRAVKQVTEGWVDLRVLLPATAGVCALIFVEIESAPLWLPLALFSFQSFNNLHQPHVTTEGEAAKPRPALTSGTSADRPKAVQRARKSTKRVPTTLADDEESA